MAFEVNRRQVMVATATVAGAAALGLSAGAACAQTPRVRPATHSSEGKAMLLSYRQGVAAMKARSAAATFDPTGWFYQSLIHGIVTRQRRDEFLNAVFDGVPETDSFRQFAFASIGTCPHADPAFLAWHRLYVYFFEKIVREASGDPNFVLPYWDYTEGGESARMPVEFHESVGNTPLDNALYNWAREPSLNGGFGAPERLDSRDIDPAALSEATFEGSETTLGFRAAVENVPHNVIHGAFGSADSVGLPIGDLGNPATAGRDPLFWVHHANIDRLWASWLRSGGENTTDYQDRDWYDRIWTFADETGARVDMSLRDLDAILETEPIEYARYDEVERQAPPTDGMAGMVVAEAPLAVDDAGIELTGDGLTRSFDVPAGAGLQADDAGTTRAFVVLEGVQAPGVFSVTFDVYVTLPGGDASGTPVGSFNLFGTVHDDMTMAQRFVFNVTDVVGDAVGAGAALSEVTVSILPRTPFLGRAVSVDSIDLVFGAP